MKANEGTAGDAGLKDGEKYKLEMAEYVYAFLKHGQYKGTVIDYVCLFNEPDWPHTQDGTHYKSLVDLAKTHIQVRDAVTQLIDNDPDFNHYPHYVFPETLGAGSITRAGGQSDQLAELVRSGSLDHLAAWGVHDYWNSGGYWPVRFKELRKFLGNDDKPIWMTEWAQRFPKADLVSGVEYGRNIVNALRQGSSAWMGFEWIHPAVNQSGLISAQWGEDVPETRYWRSKAYYMFQQIANSSPAGGSCVQIAVEESADTSVAGLEYVAIRKDNKLVVHLVNDSAQGRPYHVVGTGLGIPSGVWLTNFQNNFVLQSQSSSQGKLPPYSLVTLEFPLSNEH